MNVTLIICTYNRAEMLKRMLDSLKLQKLGSDACLEILVVDNNSTDATRQVIQDAAKNFPWSLKYLLETKQGKSFALNHGISQASGDLILFTDDDVILDSHWIEAMIEGAEKFPEAAGFGGRVIPQWPRKIPSWFLAEGPFRLKSIIPEMDMGNEVRDFEHGESTTGCNSAFRIRIFEEGHQFRTDLGYFGTDLMPGEDTEFGYSVLSKGNQIVYLPEAIIYHPTDPNRLTKKYVRERYFKIGQAQVLAFGKNKYRSLPRVFGIYRYLVPESITHMFNWFLNVCIAEWGKCFYYETRLMVNLGMVSELLKENSKKAPASARLQPVEV
jgi:glycosyltransferase involved in cell wall biosynthesis